MRNASKLIFALLLPCIISACSDSSKSKKSNGDGSDFAGSSGIAVDGYLVGSTVTCDVDNDGKSDLNEPTATTDENGKFTFTVNCVSPLLIEGGLNKTSASTSYPFLGQLKAPAGSTVVTPLTTLLVESNLTQSQLAELLGLPANTSFTTTDPTDNSDPTTADANLALYKATLAIQQIIQEMAEAFGAVPGDTTIYSAVASQVANKLAENIDGSGNITPFISNGALDSTLLNNVAASVNSDLGSPIDVNALGNLATEIKLASDGLLDPSIVDISGLEAEAETAQDPVSTPTVSVAAQSYLYLLDDSVSINASPYTFAELTDLSTTATVTTPLSTLDFDFEEYLDNGKLTTLPRLVNIGIVLENTVSNSITKLIINCVQFEYINGSLNVSIDGATKLYVYGNDNTASTVNIAFNKVSKEFLSVDNQSNTLTIHYDELVERIIAKDASFTPNLRSFLELNGNYKFTFAVSNLNLRKYNSGTSEALPLFQVAIEGAINPETFAAVPAVSGYGLEGSINFITP